jgi:hypothetical protein
MPAFGPGQQLPMFMTANEIRHNYRALDLDREWDNLKGSEETDDEVFARKLDESKKKERTGYHETGPEEYGSLHDSIAELGVHNPVSLSLSSSQWVKPQVLGGHHRIASMQDTRPNDYMPVVHVDGDNNEAKKQLGHMY